MRGIDSSACVYALRVRTNLIYLFSSFMLVQPEVQLNIRFVVLFCFVVFLYYYFCVFCIAMLACDDSYISSFSPSPSLSLYLSLSLSLSRFLMYCPLLRFFFGGKGNKILNRIVCLPTYVWGLVQVFFVHYIQYSTVQYVTAAPLPSPRYLSHGTGTYSPSVDIRLGKTVKPQPSALRRHLHNEWHSSLIL